MTPLLTRVLQEKRRLIVPLVAALALNLLAYVIVVRPLAATANGAAARAAAAAKTRQAAEQELVEAQALVTSKAQADEELAAFYQQVLPADVTAARRMTYASLPALARNTHVRYDARTTTVDENAPHTRLGHMTIRMVLQGDYQDIRRFIYQLESAPEFVIIDGLTMVDSASDGAQTLTIDLSTYYRKGDAPPPLR
jgi:hypothetical protein